MAELRDKIGQLTSDMAHQDSRAVPCDDYGPAIPSKADYNILDHRIATLQKQKAEKQMEADWKLQEPRRALRNEQANLIRISDRMNFERKRNLNLRHSMDDLP